MKNKSNSKNKSLTTLWPYGLATALVSSGLTTPVALAQESAGLEEIIVTATKRELNLQDVSQSIMEQAPRSMGERVPVLFPDAVALGGPLVDRVTRQCFHKAAGGGQSGGCVARVAGRMSPGFASV